MEENDLKKLWRQGANKAIKEYSEAELNRIVLASARKSMGLIQPKGWFQVVIIGVMVWGLVNSFLRKSPELRWLDWTGALIILVCYVVWKRSAYKMNRYMCDKPIKEWLAYRIGEVEKTMNYTAKYNGLIYVGAFLLGFGFYVATQLVLKVPFNPWVSIPVFVGLLVYLLVVKRSLHKKYTRTLKELKELYNKLDE